MRSLYAKICLLGVVAAAVAFGALSLTSRPTSSRIPASRHLPAVFRWQLIGVFPLGGQTGHPQGLNVTRDEAALSIQGATVAAVHLYSVQRTNNIITGLKLKRTLSFTQYPGLTHAGGLGRSRDRQTIYVPVAAKPFGTTAILEIGPGRSREVTRLPFHVGTLLVDPASGLLHAIGADEGVHFEIYGNSVYTFDVATGRRLHAYHPTTGESFQDCKPLTMQSTFLCSNKSGSNAMTLRGSVDLVRIDQDGSYSVLERIPVPHVNLDGSFGSDWGPYIPGVLGTPPLSYNAFDFEWSADGKALYFYFVPNDFPDTRLYAYKLVLE